MGASIWRMSIPGTVFAFGYWSMLLYVIVLGMLPRTWVLGLAKDSSSLSMDMVTCIPKSPSDLTMNFSQEKTPGQVHIFLDSHIPLWLSRFQHWRRPHLCMHSCTQRNRICRLSIDGWQPHSLSGRAWQRWLWMRAPPGECNGTTELGITGLS